MKSIVFLIFILMVSYALNEDCHGAKKDSGDDCKKLKTTASDGHCCLYTTKYSGSTNKVCYELPDASYKEIGKYLDEYKKSIGNGYEFDIDCGCSYLSISLLGLLLFLI